MKLWFEIFADSDGAIIVERYRGPGWVFVPNGPVGRPRKGLVKPNPPHPSDPRELLPPGIHIDRLTVIS